jgi:hypothetical protein
MENEYDSPMISMDDKQEIVRLSLLMARKEFEISDMAEILGFSRQTVGPFLKGKPASPELLEKGEAFAREKGYWLPDIHPGAVGMHWADAADDLVGLATFLRSSGPEDEKAFRFTHLIDFYHRQIEALAADRKGNADT